MVDVENFSDEQLRTKLLEYGFPVMPITGTTRGVMKKKLKLLMENKGKTAGKDKRRSLGRYSSEEESDTEVKATQRNRRVTMGAPLMQPPTSKVTQRKSTVIRNNDIASNNSLPTKEVKSVSTSTTVRTAKILQAAKDEFDTGSESDEIADNYNDNNLRRRTTTSTTVNNDKTSSSYFNDSLSPKTASPSSYNKSLNMTSGSTSYSGLTSSPVTNAGLSSGRLSNPYTTSITSSFDNAADRFSQIRSRLSVGGSPISYERSTYTSTHPADNVTEDRESTPFLSNFTKRLSQLSENTNVNYNYRNDIIKENDVNGSGSNVRTYLNSYRSTKVRAPLYSTYQKDENKPIWKNFSVPCTVLVFAGLFFVLIFGVYLYMGMGSDTEIDVTDIPICSKTNQNTLRYVNCVMENEVNDAKNLLRVLLPELTKRSIDNKCKDNQIKSYMFEREIVKFITTNYAIKDEYKIESDLKNLEVLTFVNPKWGISIAKLNHNDEVIGEHNIMKDMGSLAFKDNSNLTALFLLNPSLPWSCYIKNLFYICYNFVFFITICVIILYLINLLYKYYKHYNQKHQQEIITMVESIIDILQTNANENNENNFMVVNHVRDMILPIEDRKKKRKVWDGAVKYISDFESRIRTEIQVVQGEPSEVWRWLGGNNLNTSNSTKNWSWQGQAFETEIGSVNSLQCSPTPCLKIRGMFDEGDRNTILIKKSVLSKCANLCRILHCAVDTNTNCVYLKCADQNDAAIAYRSLHGWWFSGNLVTVKYIRLERYMQRFPNSPVNGPPYIQAPV